MACNLSAGHELGCKEDVGGLRELFLVALSDIRAGTVTYDVSTDEIDALPTATVYRYELDKHLSNYDEVPTYEDGGMLHFVQTLTVIIKGQTSALRKELENVMRNRVVAFTRDNNDKLKCFGIVDGLDVTGSSISSGTAKGDLYGYTLTFTGDEKDPAPFLEAFTTNPFDNFGTITVTPAYAT
jgi:hypothetical protein